MNSNGRNRNNTFAGDVLIDGDLIVTGTINGGGGGGGDVNNPMTSNLNAGNFNITNVNTLEIKSLTTSNPTQFINCNSKALSNLAAIQLDNGLSFSSSIVPEENFVLSVAAGGTIIEYKKAVFNPVEEDINMDEKNILNLNTLDTNIITSSNSSISFDGKGISNVIYIGSTNGGSDIITLNGDIRSINGHFIDGITNITGYGSGDVLNLNGDIRITNSLNLLGNNITAINNTETKGISSSTGSTAFTSILNMFNDINMNYHDIFNVERLTASHSSVSINLDMIPATEGKAGQILARDPAFVPGNFATHKLVWTNPASGTVTNPMTVNLQSAQFSIFDAFNVESKNFTVMASGSGLSCANGTFAVPITWGLAKKLSLAPFYQTFNTDYITPETNAGLTLDSKLQDGATDSKITMSAPTININNSTNLAPSNINITGNLQITNSSGYIHGNNLIVRGRNASAVPTPITIEGTTTSINSSTLNITSSTANNIAGTTNFTGTVRTNTIDANSGGTISVLQNLTLATGRQLRTDLVFSDGLRSYTTDLILAGLLPDNKTQTNIILASPQISLNNQFGTLTQETQVNIAGNIIFNNPITQPFINGSNLTIRGRNTSGVSTVLALEGSTIALTATTNINLSASGAINAIKNISLLSGRATDINPSMVLYRTVGAPSTAFNITNGATYVNVTNGQTAKGSKTIPANGLVANDLYKFTLGGLMTSDAKIDMTFSIYAGTNRLCTFTCAGDALTSQGFEFTTTLCVTAVSTGIVSLSTGIGKYEKDGKQISYAVPVNNINLIVAVANTFDIYIKPVSTMTTGSVIIYNFSIENI